MTKTQKVLGRPISAKERTTAARYTYRVWWSDEDGVFLAEAAELEGTTIDGLSPQAALENAIEAAAMWLIAATDGGDALPQPAGHNTWKARMTVASSS